MELRSGQKRQVLPVRLQEHTERVPITSPRFGDQLINLFIVFGRVAHIDFANVEVGLRVSVAISGRFRRKNRENGPYSFLPTARATAMIHPASGL